MTGDNTPRARTRHTRRRRRRLIILALIAGVVGVLLWRTSKPVDPRMASFLEALEEETRALRPGETRRVPVPPLEPDERLVIAVGPYRDRLAGDSDVSPETRRYVSHLVNDYEISATYFVLARSREIVAKAEVSPCSTQHSSRYAIDLRPEQRTLSLTCVPGDPGCRHESAYWNKVCVGNLASP